VSGYYNEQSLVRSIQILLGVPEKHQPNKRDGLMALKIKPHEKMAEHTRCMLELDLTVPNTVLDGYFTELFGDWKRLYVEFSVEEVCCKDTFAAANRRLTERGFPPIPREPIEHAD
jgi:hypothetical protein